VVRTGIDPAELVAAAGQRMTRYEQVVLDAFGGSKEQVEAVLRSALYEAAGDKTPEARKKSWHRTIRSMQEKGLIEQTACGVWGLK